VGGVCRGYGEGGGVRERVRGIPGKAGGLDSPGFADPARSGWPVPWRPGLKPVIKKNKYQKNIQTIIKLLKLSIKPEYART
jgi:hypothetical protein